MQSCDVFRRNTTISPLAIDTPILIAMLKALSGLEKSEIEFMFLATQLVRSPPTNFTNRCSAEEWRTCLWEMPTRQQNPGVIVRLMNLVKISMNFAVLRVFNQQWPEYLSLIH